MADSCCQECLDDPGHKFCPVCARPLKCKSCQTFLKAKWKNCPECQTPAAVHGTGARLIRPGESVASLSVAESSSSVTGAAGNLTQWTMPVPDFSLFDNFPSDTESFGEGSQQIYNCGGTIGAIIAGDNNQGNVNVVMQKSSAAGVGGQTVLGVSMATDGNPVPIGSGKRKKEAMGFQWDVSSRSLFRKEKNDTADIAFLKDIVTLAESVACLWSPFGTGTAFRVGTDLIMTCWHVISCITDHNHGKIQTDKGEIWVQFDYKPGDENYPNEERRFLLKELKYSNPELDVAIVQLAQNEKTKLPPPINRFAVATEGDRIQLVGHNKGHTKKLDPDCIVHKPTADQIEKCTNQLKEHVLYQNQFYDGMEQPHRLHFQCGFEKGASGCPGVHQRHGILAVVTMLAKGYPVFYHALKDQAQKNYNLDNNFFIEEGIEMSAIFDDLKLKAPDVYRDINPVC